MNKSIIEHIADLLVTRQETLTTAESCTGGGVAHALTILPGSSHWFDCAFVSYSDRAKQRLLGVTQTVLTQHGAVSKQTVIDMALGALRRSLSDFSVAVSGIAGPGGGSDEKPVGTVWFAFAYKHAPVQTRKQVFEGNRDQVREAAISSALAGILDCILRS